MRQAIVGGLLVVLSAGSPKVSAQDARIGVVNIEKILRQYKRLQEHRQLLKKREMEVRAEVEAKNKSYRELQEKRDLFAKGTPEYNKHNREMIRTKGEARSLGEAAEQELRAQAALVLASCYNQVVAEIRNYGRQQRYTLILRFNDDKISGTNPDQVTMLIAGRRVLFSDASMDLTLIVLDRLNKAHESRGAGGTSGGASGR